MVRLAYQDRVSACAGGRAALLCACAIAALAAQPALAGPLTNSPADVAGPVPQMGRMQTPGRIGDDVSSASLSGNNRAPAMPGSGVHIDVSGGSSISASGGTFDVQVESPRVANTPADPSAHGRAGALAIPSPSAGLPSMQATAAQVEQLLVTNQAPPPADQANVVDGAIVLSASAKPPASMSGVPVGAADHPDPGPPPGGNNGKGNGPPPPPPAPPPPPPPPPERVPPPPPPPDWPLLMPEP